MPGFGELFTHFWETPAAMAIARVTGSAAAVRQAGLPGLQAIVKQAGIHHQPVTLHKIFSWSENAPPGHPHSDQLRCIFSSLDDDRLEKTREIANLEQQLASLVVGTPYVLLLALPGINLVSAAEFAGEAGPIHLYPSANNLTGRAALMPSRYQSDKVDCANGPLRRMGNRRLRAVLMLIAHHLIRHNHHFTAKADLWKRQGKDPRWMRVKVAKSFARLAFAMLAGQQLLAHPCCQKRHYILEKILKFHVERRATGAQLQTDLDAAASQLPRRVYTEEAKPLQDRLNDLAKKHGPQPLANILPLVLAKLLVHQVQSTSERAPDPS
jgi:hypothetical protein